MCTLCYQFLWIVQFWLPLRYSLRRVWRYQRGNQNPYVEGEQTTQWPTYTKGQTTINKIYIKTKDRVTRTSLSFIFFSSNINDCSQDWYIYVFVLSQKLCSYHPVEDNWIYLFLSWFVALSKLTAQPFLFINIILSFEAIGYFNGHCVVCSSSIYGFWWLPLWYLQTLLTKYLKRIERYTYKFLSTSYFCL